MIIYDIHQLSELRADKPLIIVFPYAGGNAYCYRNLINKISDRYNILCPELPGRGSLSDEELIDNMEDLTQHMFTRWIVPICSNRNIRYIIYGHSMGALMSFLIAHKIKKHNLPLPRKIIISGREGPSAIKKKQIHLLSDKDFWDELYLKGGVPNEMMAYDELKEYFTPILRSDIKAVETYVYEENKILPVPITVFHGTEEDFDLDSLYTWKKETTYNVDFIQLKGNHFFIYDHFNTIINHMTSSF